VGLEVGPGWALESRFNGLNPTLARTAALYTVMPINARRGASVSRRL
jgi:hypothetical protein